MKLEEVDSIIDDNLEDYFYDIYGDVIFDTYITTLKIAKNKKRKLTKKEINRIVLYIQKYECEYLKSLLIYNFMGLFIFASKKYIYLLPSNIKEKNKLYVLTEDLVQDCILVLDKCIYRYEVQPSGSFNAYLYGEIRNRLIDNMLKKYFSAVKIPVSIYRKFRKKTLNNSEHTLFKANNHYGMPKKVEEEYLDIREQYGDSIETLITEDGEDYTLQGILKALACEINNEHNLIAFCLINGIGCEKVKSIDVARAMGLEPSTLSHRMKNLREKLKKSKKIDELKRYLEL